MKHAPLWKLNPSTSTHCFFQLLVPWVRNLYKLQLPPGPRFDERVETVVSSNTTKVVDIKPVFSNAAEIPFDQLVVLSRLVCFNGVLPSVFLSEMSSESQHISWVYFPEPVARDTRDLKSRLRMHSPMSVVWNSRCKSHARMSPLIGGNLELKVTTFYLAAPTSGLTTNPSVTKINRHSNDEIKPL